MYSIDLSWIWVDTISIKEAAKEIDGWILHVCFLWVKHQIVFVGYLHEVCRQASCSASVQLWMVMLSVILRHPWHSSRIWSNFFWKMSWEQMRPKGSCRKWYLLKALWKVISRLDSWSRMIDQYP